MNNKSSVFAVILAYLLFCTLAIAEENIEKKIKTLPRSSKSLKSVVVDKKTGKNRYLYEEVNLDNATLKEIQEYLVNNKDVSPKDFKKVRILDKAALYVIREFKYKYGVTFDDYEGKIKDKKELEIYKAARKFRIMVSHKDYYLCTGDVDAARQSFKKVSAFRKKNADKLWNNRYTDYSIEINEKMLQDCPYDSVAIMTLLDGYSYGNQERKKFNRLMLKVVEEDQVEIDHMFSGINEIDIIFFQNYQRLLRGVNHINEKLILSNKDLKMIASALLTKHRILYDFRRKFFKDEAGYHEYNFRAGVGALVNFSRLLQKSGLTELEDQIIETFLNNDDAMNVSDIYREGIKEYLEEWKKAKQTGQGQGQFGKAQ